MLPLRLLLLKYKNLRGNIVATQRVVKTALLQPLQDSDLTHPKLDNLPMEFGMVPLRLLLLRYKYLRSHPTRGQSRKTTTTTTTTASQWPRTHPKLDNLPMEFGMVPLRLLLLKYKYLHKEVLQSSKPCKSHRQRTRWLTAARPSCQWSPE